jgi:predicted nuclease of predicted toxin-antitoxin system
VRFKLDENLGLRGARLLRNAGHDVATVVEQELCGADDATLLEVCRAESRILITFDKDFSSVLRFPPRRYAGIVVLRLPEPLRLQIIEEALTRFLDATKSASPEAKLWIVDERRIREFEGPEGS